MCKRNILALILFLFVSGLTNAKTIKWRDFNHVYSIDGSSFLLLQEAKQIKERVFISDEYEPEPEFVDLTFNELQEQLLTFNQQKQIENLKFQMLVKQFNETTLKSEQQRFENNQANIDNTAIAQENSHLKQLFEQSKNKLNNNIETLELKSNKLNDKLSHQQALSTDLQQQLIVAHDSLKNNIKILDTDTGVFKIEYLFGSKLKKANIYRANFEYKKALSTYLDLVDKNNFNALFNVANMIYQGLGVKANATKAFLFYLKAAKQGLANAQYNAALMLSLGKGVEKDEEQSLFWYKEAAEQGYDKTH
jgi:hypothetical protein